MKEQLLESTFTLTGDIAERTGVFPTLIVPAVVLLLALLGAGVILLATRMRQRRFDAERRNTLSQLEKDREVIARIHRALEKEIAPENIEEVFQEIYHYAWMLTHERHMKFTAEIRDYDTDRLHDFPKAVEDLTRIREKAKKIIEQ